MKIRLLVLLSLLSLGVFSQQKIEVRPSFGLNWNNTKEPMRENFNYMAGFGVNNYGHRFYAETGAYWVGFKTPDSVKMNQLRFPVKIGINVVNKDKKFFNLRFFAGPVANVTIEVPNLYLSLNAGVGVDIFPFFLSVGYDLGITDYKDVTDYRHNVYVNNFYVKTGFIIMSRNKYYR